MLVGSFEHSLDEKSRVVIPSKFREDLGRQVVLVKGIGADKCIYAFGIDEWNNFAERIMHLKLPNNVRRNFYASADEREPDKQGRIVISNALKAHANIKDDVIIIGYQNKMEIWSKEEWENNSAGIGEGIDEETMELLENSGLGI